MTIPVVLCWSGGKDSVLALDAMRAGDDYDVVALLTTLTRDFDRIAMHGVRRELLVRQASLLDCPLAEVWIDAGAGNDEYEAAMAEQFTAFAAQGVATVAFGDLFLEDVRDYRIRQVAKLKMTPVFPIWGRDTTDLAREFVDKGYRAKTCCVDTRVLPETFCGRDLSEEFFRDLPADVDPCGENGEFHSFVYDGPMFSAPLNVTTGGEHHDDPFVFRDILPLGDDEELS